MKQTRANRLLLGILLSMLMITAGMTRPCAATQNDMTVRKNLYECQQKAAEYAYNLDKAGDMELIEKHVQECLAAIQPPTTRLTAAAAKPADSGSTTVTINNMSGRKLTIFLGFNANSCYQPENFSSFCTPTADNKRICSFELLSNNVKSLLFAKPKCTASFVVSAERKPWTDCAVTQAEFTIRDYWAFNDRYMDTYDISLVNGFNIPMSIVPSSGMMAGPVKSATGNQNSALVFPLACDGCDSRISPPSPCKADVKDRSECHADKYKQPCQLSVESAGVTGYMVHILQ